MNDRMEIMTIFPSKEALVLPHMYTTCLSKAASDFLHVGF